MKTVKKNFSAFCFDQMTCCRRYQHSSLIAESTSVYITISKKEAFSFGLGCNCQLLTEQEQRRDTFYLKFWPFAIC